ncbi:MAG: STAS domain-containing protein [Pseudomonadota bacterium]
MSQASLQTLAAGQVAVRGELTFYSVPELLRDSKEVFTRGQSIVIDLAGVTRSDSAGIALVLEWLRSARRQRAELRFVNVPEQMQALARVGGVDALLAW